MEMEASRAAYTGAFPTESIDSLPTNTSSPSLLQFFWDYQNNDVIVTHYNYTGKLQTDRYREGLKPEAIAFLVVCLLIILENAVVLIAIWTNKKFHLPMYYLLGNCCCCFLSYIHPPFFRGQLYYYDYTLYNLKKICYVTILFKKIHHMQFH